MSYCCTQNLGNIIKLYNKKPINSNNQIILPYNCGRKEDCSFYGKCRGNDVVYKCIASANGFPNKVYFGTAQGEFKKQFNNHDTNFKNKSKKDNTTLARYIWDLKLKHNVMPTLNWHMESVVPYSNKPR